jgi:hypothetical protein
MAAVRAAARAIAGAVTIMRAIMVVHACLCVPSGKMLRRRDLLGQHLCRVSPATMRMRGSRRRPEGNSNQHQHGQEPAHAAIPRSNSLSIYRLSARATSGGSFAKPAGETAGSSKTVVYAKARAGPFAYHCPRAKQHWQSGEQ